MSQKVFPKSFSERKISILFVKKWEFREMTKKYGAK
jgi:hypothetical protein